LKRAPLALAVIRLAALAGAAAAGVVAACETADLGPMVAGINVCRPGQQFFVDQIWPNVLSKDYGGKHCYDSGCHNGVSGGSLLLQIPTNPGAVPLPPDWLANYKSASQLMNCSNVKASKLLAYPGGLLTHGGGKLFEPDGPEAMLIQMWVSQP
jgi:hypothetical protein